MALLSRTDQERIKLWYEREYGVLVMRVNREGRNPLVCRKALALHQEIRRHGRAKYFDDDLVAFFRDLSQTIAHTLAPASRPRMARNR